MHVPHQARGRLAGGFQQEQLIVAVEGSPSRLLRAAHAGHGHHAAAGLGGVGHQLARDDHLVIVLVVAQQHRRGRGQLLAGQLAVLVGVEQLEDRVADRLDRRLGRAAAEGHEELVGLLGVVLELERPQAALAVIRAQLGQRHLAVLVGVHLLHRRPRASATETGQGGEAADRQSGHDLLDRRRPLGLLLAQDAVLVDIQLGKQLLEEIAPERLHRFAVHADMEAHQHRPGLADENEFLHVVRRRRRLGRLARRRRQGEQGRKG